MTKSGSGSVRAASLPVILLVARMVSLAMFEMMLVLTLESEQQVKTVPVKVTGDARGQGN
jgi:hypothetical protein